MDLFQFYQQKMIACTSRKITTNTHLNHNQEIKNILADAQHNTKGNRLEIRHIMEETQKYENFINKSCSIKLMVAVTNPIRRGPHYWAHLAFLVNTSHSSWLLYGYIRGQFNKKDLPYTSKDKPYGSAAYLIKMPDNYLIEKTQTLTSHTLK